MLISFQSRIVPKHACPVGTEWSVKYFYLPKIGSNSIDISLKGPLLWGLPLPVTYLLTPMFECKSVRWRNSRFVCTVYANTLHTLRSRHLRGSPSSLYSFCPYLSKYPIYHSSLIAKIKARTLLIVSCMVDCAILNQKLSDDLSLFDPKHLL